MIRRAASLAIFLALAPELYAQGQQQFGQPPNTHLSWASAPPPNGTAMEVTYFIGTGFTAAQMTSIRQAAGVWNNANLGVKLIESGTSAGGGIQVNADPTLPVGTAGTFGRTLVPGAGLFPDGNPWNRITAAAFTINTSLPFSTGPVGAGQYDFRAVMVDLFGLSLGLGFAGAGDPLSVMRNNIPTGPLSSTLSPGDIQALAILYGSPEPATWTLFGAGLLAMGAARRKRKSSKPI